MEFVSDAGFVSNEYNIFVAQVFGPKEFFLSLSSDTLATPPSVLQYTGSTLTVHHISISLTQITADKRRLCGRGVFSKNVHAPDLCKCFLSVIVSYRNVAVETWPEA